MTSSIRLGRVAGVEVGVNWSVLAIFALVTLSLAGGRFPVLYPGRATAVYWAAGLIAAVVFFLSLLAHEVSHAVVAMRHGVEVEGITLWLFGGVARLKGEAGTPGAELRVAGVGPLVSLVLGGVFLTAAVALSGVGVDGLPFATVAWLGGINLVLALFNLIPAAPLDGGRLLRAALWKRRGDRRGAAVTAAKAGQVFGFGLVGVGLWGFLAGGGFGGIWLVLIGWFLVTAAQAERQHAELSGRLSGVRVADVMTADPGTVPDDPPGDRRTEEHPLRLAPDDELVDVLPRLLDGPDGRALVMDDGRLVGIVTRTDVARAVELASPR